MQRHRSLPLAAVICLALVAAGCTQPRSTDAARGPRFVSDTAGAPFKVRGSINQIFVTGATPGSSVTVYDITERPVTSGTVDELGSLVFRQIPAGADYRVQAGATNGEPAPTSERITVKAVEGSTPPESFYRDQQLQPGLQYITTRDGTTLSAYVFLPGPADKGPYPTVVEYSGYTPSNPTVSLRKRLGLSDAEATRLCATAPVVCNTPDQPASLIAAAMGYAVVAVNMRGTGCSGGAYDFFEPLQLTDGYDIVEVAAAQKWALKNKVGMVGLSYPGISQLFVASTRPPGLAAISPLSVYDDTARGVLAPGGIFNEGFALAWARNVLDEAKPEGQAWTKTVIAAGDQRCADNQKMRLQNVDAVAKAKRYPFYDPAIADPLNPALFVDRINVPVFMTGAWQDEQTGGRFSNLWDKFTGAPFSRFYGFNGAHADGFSPETLVEWKAFLDVFVAGKITPIPDFFTAIGPQFIQQIFGAAVPIPQSRWTKYASFDEAKAAYLAAPRYNVLFDRGGGDPTGAPVAQWSAGLDSWPAPADARSWFLQPDGSLGTSAPPADGGASRFTTSADLARQVTLPGDNESDAFLAKPRWDWRNDLPGDAAAFVSAPLEEDTVVLGNSNADLWVRSSASDGELGVTLSEVRPDGQEMYVQSGFLRLVSRKLAPGSTELRPLHSFEQADAAPMPVGGWDRAQVEMLPVGHLFRKGSRIRISVHTPGGDKPRWSWILQPFDTPPVLDIGHDRDRPSRIVLPVVGGLSGWPADPPACPSLRGQPCRSAQPYRNQQVAS